MSIFVEGKETFLLGLQRLHGRNKERRGSKEGICKDLVETLEKENIDYAVFERTGRNLEQKRGEEETQNTRQVSKESIDINTLLDQNMNNMLGVHSLPPYFFIHKYHNGPWHEIGRPTPDLLCLGFCNLCSCRASR